MSRVTIQEAAKMLGITEQYLRVSLQRGAFPFGVAMKVGSERYTYYVNKERLERWIGGEIDGGSEHPGCDI